MEIVCATTNKSKLDDYRRIATKLTSKANPDEVIRMISSEYYTRFAEELIGREVSILGLDDILDFDGDISIPKVAETGMSLYENAGIKARAAYNALGKRRTVFADDSGNWINGIGGPAVFTGRYAEDRKNIKRCLEQMDTLENAFSNIHAEDRKITTTTVICMITCDGEEHYFSGSLEGRISRSICKDDYDSIDDTKPAWANILYPHFKFCSSISESAFAKRAFKTGKREPAINMFGPDDAIVLYDDICPRRIALLNMLCWIQREGI